MSHYSLHALLGLLTSFYLTVPLSGQLADPIDATLSPGPAISLVEVAAIPSRNGTPRLNHLAHAFDGSGRLFVNEMQGRLFVLENGSTLRPTPYLDLQAHLTAFVFTGGQQGFSSFAFHPEFATNGKLYVVASVERNTDTPDFPTKTPIGDFNQPRTPTHHDILLEFTAADPAAMVFSGTVREIFRIEQPYNDHNIGLIAFHPTARPGDEDYGLLYLATGDGGNWKFPHEIIDPLENAQDLNSPLGKLLRIDPLGTNSSNGQYGIPASNPWSQDGNPATLGEIYAYGFRNPHRFSWDLAGEGALLLVDVGEAFIEEVNRIERGGNYGWPLREGTFITERNVPGNLYAIPGGHENEDLGFQYPVLQYDRNFWNSAQRNRAISIGFVYRGSAIPALEGLYVFGDFPSGYLFVSPVHTLQTGSIGEITELRPVTGPSHVTRRLAAVVGSDRPDFRLGQDAEGELFLTTKSNGRIYKIVAPASSTTTYAGWAEATLPADARDPAADPDADGLTNLVEFAFGSDPLDPASAAHPVLDLLATDGGSFLTLETTRDLAAAGIHWWIESSDDLAGWQRDPGATVLLHRSETEDGRLHYTTRAQSNAESGGPRFLRVRVELTE